MDNITSATANKEETTAWWYLWMAAMLHIKTVDLSHKGKRLALGAFLVAQVHPHKLKLLSFIRWRWQTQAAITVDLWAFEKKQCVVDLDLVPELFVRGPSTTVTVVMGSWNCSTTLLSVILSVNVHGPWLVFVKNILEMTLNNTCSTSVV